MITAIVQARLGSTRLPGKVLLPLGDSTILGWVVKRIQTSKRIASVIVATTVNPGDDPIASWCRENNVPCFRGDENDVLDRYYQCAVAHEAKHIARITSDCPLIDPELIDAVADKYEEGSYQYVANCRVRETYPDGMDTEIFSFEALEKAWREAKLQSEREHVTPYIWKNPKLFTQCILTASEDLSMYRLTVDEQRDYDVVRVIVTHASDLSVEGMVKYLRQHPEVLKRNLDIERNAGYYKSLRQDAEHSNK